MYDVDAMMDFFWRSPEKQMAKNLYIHTRVDVYVCVCVMCIFIFEANKHFNDEIMRELLNEHKKIVL